MLASWPSSKTFQDKLTGYIIMVRQKNKAQTYWQLVQSKKERVEKDVRVAAAMSNNKA